MAILITKGTKLTCEGGHHIATATRDIEAGEKTSVSQFDWLIDPPKKLKEACPVCGAPYVRPGRHTHVGIFAQLHTPEGWKP